MRTNHRIRSTALLLAVLLLFSSCAFAEGAAEPAAPEKAAGLPDANPASFFSWFFATGSLPEGASLAENTLRISSLYPRESPEGETPQPETVTSVTLTRKEGSSYPFWAVKAVTDEEGALISLDPEYMRLPGSAAFTLVLESEHYRFETDQRLTVVSATGVPTFTQKLFNPVFNITPGSTFTAQNLLGSIISVDYPAFCQAAGLPYPDAAVTVAETDIPGLSRDEATGLFTLEDYGVYDLNLDLRIANLSWTLPFRIESEPYSITGPSFLMPGSTVRYKVTDLDAAPGRRYTWSVEGDGAEIDPADGTLTLSKDAQTDVYIKVRLTPDTAPAISTSVFVPGGVLPRDLYLLHEPAEETDGAPAPLTEREAGFSVSVPEGAAWQTVVSSARQNGWIFRCASAGMDGASVTVDARTDAILTGFREDDLAAMSFYNENVFPDTVKDLQSRDIRIDGHLARQTLFTLTDAGGQATRYGQISYCRNNQALTVRVFSSRQGAGADSLIPVTFRDLDRITEGIRYEPDEHTIRREDAQLTLTVKDDQTFVVAGKSLYLTAAFANTELINRASKNDGLVWEVADAETGEKTDAAAVSKGNALAVNRNLDRMTKLRVTVTSEQFGTKASCEITACPLTKELTMDPDLIYWYRDSENKPVTVKASINPEDIPLSLLTWKAYDEEKVKLEASDDGTAVLTFLAPGPNSVNVTAPDGKSGIVRIRTVFPVESVRLKTKGEAKPGASVTLVPLFEPDKGVLKTVKWSVDVGKDVAEISQKGVLTIHPAAEPGTVITVTCEALGAPEPVTATEQITVE